MRILVNVVSILKKVVLKNNIKVFNDKFIVRRAKKLQTGGL